MNKLHQWIDFNFALLCRNCKSKVVDPDKSKGQIYLKGKCPTCKGESSEKLTKKQRKLERKLQREEQARMRSKRSK